MSESMNVSTMKSDLTLVLGGTGKTGRRVVEGLRAKGLPVRVGSRSASPAFDWDNESLWSASLEGVKAVYITYAPDLAVPGAKEAIQAFVNLAKEKGVQRLVLLSGRGEAEAQACEEVIQGSGLEWTIVRASWFHQNFSEGAFDSMVMSGQITLPAVETLEPFVDVDDIAEVAVEALSAPGHAGELYEVTGPQLLSFHDIAASLSEATGRDIQYIPIPHEAFVAGVEASGAPKEVVWMMDYLFATVLDGRNANLCDGIQRALGRPPRDFATYARNAARSGAWNVAA